MKLLLALPTIVLLSVVAACGNNGKPTSSMPQISSNAVATGSTPTRTTFGAKPAPRPLENDNDHDNDNGNDDIAWGHAANTDDRQAVTALVKRYYAAAAADNGATACSLIYSIFAEEIPEVYGQSPPGEPALRGKTCAVVMSKLFKQRHQQLVVDSATLKVAGVRVKGLRGLALLSLRMTPERDIPVHREHRAWTIDALLDSGLG